MYYNMCHLVLSNIKTTGDDSKNVDYPKLHTELYSNNPSDLTLFTETQ